MTTILKKEKILYVDDEAPNLMLFKLSFRNELEVCLASSGHEALEKLEDPEIKLVISDMRMPQMNGIQFIREARKIRNDIKYYLLTGFDLNEEIVAAIEDHTIDDYFKKPFNKQEIISKMN